jgi:putative transcriptional regulator
MSVDGDTLGKMTENAGWLNGKLLIAMPSMPDPRFHRTVIFICSHSPSGAMGLILNRLYGELNFRGLLEQLNLSLSIGAPNLPIHFGGPVEPGRGFVLHSAEYQHEGTVLIDDHFCMTATVEILQDIANGEGPRQAMLALGYAGWGAGQLDMEMQSNGWLVAEPSTELVFSPAIENKWDRALAILGVSPMLLSVEMGHA